MNQGVRSFSGHAMFVLRMASFLLFSAPQMARQSRQHLREKLSRIRPLPACFSIKQFPTVPAVALFIVLVSAFTAMKAQAQTGTNRPATVPAEFVFTPAGYFHPSCINHLGKGDTLRPDEQGIEHSDGSFESIPECGYPRYNSRGQVVSNQTTVSVSPSIGSAWVEDYGLLTSTSFGKLTANWTVPPAPTSNDNQTLFFFPGMIDNGTGGNIIQPVLTWNSDSGNPNAPVNVWSIASWNCCVANTISESTSVTVNTGDTLLGTMQSTCSAGTLSCGYWDITTQDVTAGTSTSLTQSSSNGQTFNLVFPGAVEVDSVVQCSDYPPNGAIEFSNVALYDDNFNQISTPPWTFDAASTANTSGLTPQCNYGGQETGQQVSFSYGTLPAPVLQSSYRCLISGGVEHCYELVGMSDSNTSVSIYYTTDGSTPTTSSALYAGDIEVAEGTIIKAIAVLGSSQSAVTTYTANGGSN